MIKPRLILLGLYQFTGWDFRSGMMVTVLALGLLTLGMIWTAKTLRGRASYIYKNSNSKCPYLVIERPGHEDTGPGLT